MIEITIAGAQFGVQDGHGATGPMKILRLVDPQSGIQVVAPFDLEPSRQLAAALGGIVLAKDMPKPPAIH